VSNQSVRGVVIEIRPKALYRIRLEDGRVVTANIESSLRHAILRILVNDEVQVQLSQNDPTRGRIIQVADK
jgi:translation initiation factor IF-1